MSIELKRMTPSRAAYFMERFKREEKLLGQNEQAALTYVIDMLEKATTIQQAEAQQPATSEPAVRRNPFASRCYTMSESHLSGHRLIVGFEKLGDAQDAHEWVTRQVRGDFTHPAPSVPDDVVRDAERYRWLREQNESLESFTFYVGCDNGPDDDGSVEWVGADLDAAIDAAMLAAKEGGAA